MGKNHSQVSYYRLPVWTVCIFIILPLLISNNIFSSNIDIIQSLFSNLKLAITPYRVPSIHHQFPKKSSGRIAFTAFKDGSWDLWIMTPDGSSPLQLTKTAIDERTPCISSDGNEIIYSTSDGSLWMINLIDNTIRKMPLPEGNYGNPVWINKTKILFVSFMFRTEKDKVIDDSSLLVLDLEEEAGSDNPYVLIDQTGLQEWPSIFPVRQNLLYSSSVQGPNLEVTQEIWFYDFITQNGDQLTLMNANSIQGKWSPDGKKIVFSSNKTGNYEIWVYNLSTEKSVRLTDTSFSNTEPCWSPDGKEIAFISNRRGLREIWKMSDNGEILGVVAPFKEKIECMNPYWGK